MHGGLDDVWAEDARLPREILDSLGDLNARFLELLRSGSEGYRRYLPAPVPAVAANPLTRPQCEAAARCPYALFDLRFDDDAHWQLRLAGARQWQVADETATDPHCVEFVRVALFFVWHAVRVHAISAQLTLGMTPGCLTAFRQVSLDRLPALAPSESLYLRPRWRESLPFWAGLLGAAAARDTAVLRRVQLHGVQLAAAARLIAPPSVS